MSEVPQIPTRRCLNCKKRFPVFEHCEGRQFCTRQCSRDYDRCKEANPHHPRHEPRCTPEMADKILHLLVREMPDAHLVRHLKRDKRAN